MRCHHSQTKALSSLTSRQIKDGCSQIKDGCSRADAIDTSAPTGLFLKILVHSAAKSHEQTGSAGSNPCPPDTDGQAPHVEKVHTRDTDNHFLESLQCLLSRKSFIMTLSSPILLVLLFTRFMRRSHCVKTSSALKQTVKTTARDVAAFTLPTIC